MSKINKYIEKKSAESKSWRKTFNDEYHSMEMSVLMTQLRESTGLSKVRFAELVGKPRTTIDRIEKAQMRPTVELMEEIANKAGKRLVIKVEDIDKEEVEA